MQNITLPTSNLWPAQCQLKEWGCHRFVMVDGYGALVD